MTNTNRAATSLTNQNHDRGVRLTDCSIIVASQGFHKTSRGEPRMTTRANQPQRVSSRGAQRR